MMSSISLSVTTPPNCSFFAIIIHSSGIGIGDGLVQQPHAFSMAFLLPTYPVFIDPAKGKPQMPEIVFYD
jgi:hypothetical protein